MRITVFDIEGNSLTPDKIWVLAYYDDGKLNHVTDYEDMKRVLASSDVLVGHNITRFDIPVLEKLLGITINAKLVDTLALSWYLYPNRIKHGLEEWGEELGIKKPDIIEWDNPLLIEEYIHRCREDVKINTKLWKKMFRYLTKLYGSEENIWKFLDYLAFKMDCAREQERSGWKLDTERCKNALNELLRDKEEVFNKLIEVMPEVAITVKKTKPAKPFKKDGTYSTAGAVWFNRLAQLGLPVDYNDVVEVVNGYKQGNPNSSTQIKSWLLSYGWVPQTFKYNRDKDTGEVKQIPQINLENSGGICPSVKKLYDKNPNFKLLEGIGVVSHRISILEGFLKACDKDGYIQAQVAGLTNTLRFKHKTIVNLPKVNKPFGDIIRGVLIAPKGKVLCGSDMSSLEDRLKQHFIYPYDPDYVKEMQTDDFDPHLDLAFNAGEVNAVQVKLYKDGVDKSIKPIRDLYKTGNYALQYRCGVARLAISLGVSQAKATFIYEAYWKRNWAIKEVDKAQHVVTINEQMWLKNPINGFFYSLRYEKDIFSTLVQGSASYVFDLWVQEFRSKRSQLTGQFHDEVIICIKEGAEKKAEDLLRASIKNVNDKLKLNRELAIDVQFGHTYAEIH